jgi:hypothetical protein
MDMCLVETALLELERKFTLGTSNTDSFANHICERQKSVGTHRVIY